jgi:dTDP-4-dehydrorhamnose reductase
MDLRARADISSIITQIAPDVIVLVAGTRDISYCQDNPGDAYTIHAEATRILAQTVARLRGRLVYISTDCVFNGTNTRFTERDQPAPYNIYGHAKLLGEYAVLAASRSNAVVRTSLVFGWPLARQTSNTVADVVMSLLQRHVLCLPTNLFNTPIFLSTAAHAIASVATSSLTGIFHLAGRERISRYKLGVEAAKAFSLDHALISPTECTLGIRPRNSCLDSSRLMTALSMTPPTVRAALTQMKADRQALRALGYRPLRQRRL